MKIIEINKLYYPWVGGVETHVKNIAEGLNKWAKVNVICCNTESKTTTETIHGIQVTKYKSIGKLLSLPLSWAFISNFKTHSADILHFHLPNPLAVIAYFLNRPKGRVLITWHSDIIKQRITLFFYTPLLKWFLKTADRIITTSPNMVQNSPFLSKHQDKIDIIPLGIDPKNYPNVNKIPNQQRFALFVGRLIYYKGVVELIEALKQTSVNIIMIGEGPLDNMIKSSGKELIEKKQLTIHPFQERDQLNQFFNHCDFFILPSTHASEAFGIVQLEAMIYEKPIISTNLPTGVPYVNQHQHTGLVVEPKNINALATAMQTLWDNESLRIEYGKNAKTRCLNEFTEEQMISKTKETLLNLNSKKE